MSVSDLIIRPDIGQFWAESFLPIVLGMLFIILTSYLCLMGSEYMIYSSAGTLLLWFYIFYLWLFLRAHIWIVRTEEIIQRVGVFSLVVDHLEMYRIVDYQEQQSFLQRLFGVKTIVLISTDRLNSALIIKGLPSSSPLMNLIRSRVEVCKTNKRIYEIANH